MLINVFGASLIDNQKPYKGFLMCLISSWLIISAYIMGEFELNPRAIDVYRGKTTLKVTEKMIDGIVVERDSVVIFKNNEL